MIWFKLDSYVSKVTDYQNTFCSEDGLVGVNSYSYFVLLNWDEVTQEPESDMTFSDSAQEAIRRTDLVSDRQIHFPLSTIFSRVFSRIALSQSKEDGFVRQENRYGGRGEGRERGQ